MTIDELLHSTVQPHLWHLKPYSSARNEFSGSARLYLDANENPFAAAHPYNRYPDSAHVELRTALAAHRGLQPDQVLLTNGSDEGIDLLYKAVCTPGNSNVVVCPPTYGMYAVQAGVFNVRVQEVPLVGDFELDAPAVLRASDDNTRIVWLCSPNNPTGNVLHAKAVELVLRNTTAWVVVDEAYIDYAGHEQSWLPRLNEFHNLVVLHTFSKAWGLAGLRLGALYAHPALLSVLRTLKLPYNLNSYTLAAAQQLLQRAAAVQIEVEVLRAEALALTNALRALPFVQQVFPTQANFLLVRVTDANHLYTTLLQQGIVVRNRNSLPGCAGCVRISVGTPAENTQLLKALTAYADVHPA